LFWHAPSSPSQTLSPVCSTPSSRSQTLSSRAKRGILVLPATATLVAQAGTKVPRYARDDKHILGVSTFI